MTATELEINLGRTMIIWWAYVWRTAALGIIIGFIVGFSWSLAGLVMGLDKQIVRNVNFIFMCLISVPVGIWALKKVLSKKFKDFRIALLPIENSNQI